MIDSNIKLYVVPHSHMDIEWFWTEEDLKSTLLPKIWHNGVVPMLHKDVPFSQDQMLIFQHLKDALPKEEWEFVVNAAERGLLEPVGGMYVQPEMQTPCGESLIEQIRIGQGFLKENFGKTATSAWNIDSFGQTHQLPQILLKSGYHSYVFMRDVEADDNPKDFPSTFYYQSPDGSKIMTHWLKNTYVFCEHPEENLLVQTGAITVTEENQEEILHNTFASFKDENSVESQTRIALLLWGNDLYVPTYTHQQIKDTIIEAAAYAGVKLDAENIIITTPKEYFDALSAVADKLPIKDNDFGTPEYIADLRGTFISRIKLKLQNRQAENELLALEGMSAVLNKPFNTESIWKNILFNHFHDTIGGSCTDEVYINAFNRYNRVFSDILYAENNLICADDRSENILVYNPTSRTRTDVIKIENCREGYTIAEENGLSTPCYLDENHCLHVLVTDIAPYSFKRYSLVHGAPAPSHECECSTLENQYYKIEFDDLTGNIVAIYNKLDGKTLSNGFCNTISAASETDPDLEGGFRFNGTVDNDLNCKAEKFSVTKNDLQQSVTVEKSFKGFKICKTVILPNHANRIDFTTEIIDYTGEDLLISADFSIDKSMENPLWETPFYVHHGKPGYRCVQNWGGFKGEDGYIVSLMNQGTPGYWFEDNHIKVALLRGFKNYTTYTMHRQLHHLQSPDDMSTHSETATELGYHKFCYSLTAGNTPEWTFCEAAKEYNAGLLSWKSDYMPELSFGPLGVTEGFVVTRLEGTNDQCFLLRGYNATCEDLDVMVTFSNIVQQCTLVNLLNESISALEPNGNKVQFSTKPNEIVSIRVKW